MGPAIRSARPLLLLLAALNYLLGLAAANYLGLPFRAGLAWLGLGWVLLLQAGTGILTDAFRPLTEQGDATQNIGERLAARNRLVLVFGVMLVALAAIMLASVREHDMSAGALGLQAAALALSILYAVPPARLAQSGFGELIQSVMLAAVPAGLAFLLQAGEYHRILGFATFALVLLGLAWLLTLDFPSFAADEKYDRRTLLRRIGWERAVPLHHAFVLAAYGLLLLAPFMGVSLPLVWPAFLTLPFAVLQVFLVRGIALGGRPNWPLLAATSTAVFGLTTYLLTLSLWIR